MSSSGVISYPYLRQWQTPAASAAATDTIGNSGTIATAGTIGTSGTLAAFLQSFSIDLQAMLAQLDSGTTSTASDSGAAHAAANRAATTHHHRHHHVAGGAQQAANRLIGEIGDALPGGTPSADQINQSASMLATDVMQALRAYGGAASSPAIPLATV